MFIVEWFFCPDGIIPDFGLTELNNIYIYIYSHPQIVSLYHNSSLWLDTEDAWSRDQNRLNLTLDLVSYRLAIKRTTSARELLGIM